MENLSHKEILRLNVVIGDLYSLRDLKTFHFQALQLLRKVVRVDFLSYNEFDLSARVRSTVHGDTNHAHAFSKYGAALKKYGGQHPVWSALYLDIGKVKKVTDFTTTDQFRHSPLYNEYYRHLDTRHQIFVPLTPDHQYALFFALHRKDPDFTENERTILTFLRPHIINALRNVSELWRLKTERDLLEKGIETERQGALLIDCEGTILGITPLARELMKKYLDASPSEGDHLAGELMAWFMREVNPPSPPFNKGGNSISPPLEKGDSGGFARGIERPPFVVDKGGGCLKITLARDAATGDCIILLYERDAASILKGIEKHGLSCREAEVLVWVGKGKTNQEIAIILNMSRRTVEKHLEKIYEKLGVETRTAAAAMVQK